MWSMGATLAGWVNDLKSAVTAVQEAAKAATAASHPVSSGRHGTGNASLSASAATPTKSDSRALVFYRRSKSCGAGDASRISFSAASLPLPRSVVGVEWKPGRPLPEGWQEPKKEGRKPRKKRLKKEAEERRRQEESIRDPVFDKNHQVRGTAARSPGPVREHCQEPWSGAHKSQCQPTKACLCKPTRQGKVRLFAFGMDRARKRILQQLVDGWCPVHDIFVS